MSGILASVVVRLGRCRTCLQLGIIELSATIVQAEGVTCFGGLHIIIHLGESGSRPDMAVSSGTDINTTMISSPSGQSLRAPGRLEPDHSGQGQRVKTINQ